ncbi:MAG: hypothetical protein QF733_05985 [Phycisphaerales bacterium]|jgi:hypothetical protein|nr:hypothetical protein [Phycisphaerales bacterium]
MHELVHTWAGMGAEGGFQTVRRSPGLSDAAAEALIDRSGMVVSDPPARPILAFRMLPLDGTPTAVLTRIVQTPGPTPARPCRLAHHLVLNAHERPECGPAALLTGGWLPDVWQDDWEATAVPEHVAATPPGELDPAWSEFVLRRAEGAACTTLITPEGTAPEACLAAMFASFPAEDRWRVTFLCNGFQLPDAALLRLVSDGSVAAARLAHAGEGLTVHLTEEPPRPEPITPPRREQPDIPLRLEAREGPPILVLVLAVLTLIALAVAAWTLGVFGP